LSPNVGVISACTATVQTYSGLVAIRFFLGFVEAAYFVCASRLRSAILIDTLHSPDVFSSSPLGIPARNWVFVRLCFTPAH